MTRLIFVDHCSTCKCIYNVFLEGGEFHILVFDHFDSSPFLSSFICATTLCLSISKVSFLFLIDCIVQQQETRLFYLWNPKWKSGKVGLKLNIQKIKIMASHPITSWEIDGETEETVSDFIFGGSKITVDGDCSHEIKRCSLLGRKVMTNLDSILKSRDITLPTKVPLVKAMVFPVVMYGCESWAVKKAECQRIDAF